MEYRVAGLKGGMVDDAAIVYANKKGLILPSTRLLNPLLHANKISFGAMTEGIISGTVVALEKKDAPFGKEVVWKPSKNIVKRYIVPSEFSGNENCGLVSEQGFDGSKPTINVEVKNKKGTIYVTYEIDPKYIVCVPNMPLESKGYFPEMTFGLPTNVLQGPDAMLLQVNIKRENPFIGSVGRRNGSPNDKFAPAGMVDMNFHAFKPAKVLLVNQENYGEFVKCSEKMHEQLLKPVLIISNTTGTVRVTLEYGIPDALWREYSTIQRAKAYPKGVDPDHVNATIQFGRELIELPMSDNEKICADLAAKTVKIGLQDKKPEISVLVGKTVKEIQAVIGTILSSR